MARDFSFLFWGLVFLLVEINFNRFDLFPGFIGCALIALGSHNLAQYAPPFRLARNLASPLVLLFILRYALPQNLSPTFLIFTAVLTLVLVGTLLAGIIRFTKDRERPDLAAHAVIYRRVYVSIAVIGLFFQQVSRVEPEAAAALAGLMTIGTLAILFFILRLLHAVKQDLAFDSSII